MTRLPTPDPAQPEPVTLLNPRRTIPPNPNPGTRHLPVGATTPKAGKHESLRRHMAQDGVFEVMAYASAFNTDGFCSGRLVPGAPDGTWYVSPRTACVRLHWDDSVPSYPTPEPWSPAGRSRRHPVLPEPGRGGAMATG